mgnify:CR=1 FL=1
MPPLPIVTVVYIPTGEKRAAAIAKASYATYPASLYWVENLRKDSRPNEARHRDGALIDAENPFEPYALYDDQRDQERERKAADVRSHIKSLIAALNQSKDSLQNIYLEPSQKEETT